MVTKDGQISVMRSLTRKEWMDRIAAAGIELSDVKIRWFLVPLRDREAESSSALEHNEFRRDDRNIDGRLVPHVGGIFHDVPRHVHGDP